MTISRAAIAGLVLGLCWGLLTASQPSERLAAPRLDAATEDADVKLAPSLGPASFAFLTAAELVVMRGLEVVSRVPASDNRGLHETAITTNGQHVVHIVDGQSPADRVKDRKLVIIDTRTGITRSIDCDHCSSVVAIDDHRILAGKNATMLLIDLSGDYPSETFRVQVGTSAGILMAGFSNGALMAGLEDELEVYYVFTLDGTTKRVLTKSMGKWPGTSLELRVHSAAAINTAAGEAFFAVSRYSDEGECPSYSEAFLFGSPGSQVVYTDFSLIPEVRPLPDFLSPNGKSSLVTLRNLWWGNDGRVHAVITSGTCQGESAVIGQKSGEWILERGRWVQASSESLQFLQEIDSQTRLVVTSGPDRRHGGALYLEFKGERAKVADDVYEVYAPPPAATAMGSVSDISDLLCPHANDIVCTLGVDYRVNLGAKTGDIDGDGKSEVVTAILEDLTEPLVSERDQPAVGRLLIQATLANGRRLDEAVKLEVDADAAWLGISDLDGDGRDELVISPFLTEDTAGLLILEYRDDRLGPNRRIFDGYWTLEVSPQQKTGLVCEKNNGKARLVVYRISPLKGTTDAQYRVTETVYEPVVVGAFALQVSTRELVLAESAALELMGVNCAGLDPWFRE